MNYLVHLFLSDGSDGGLLGNLMGDFVKGPLDSCQDPQICRGIVQHRRVDAFAQENIFFQRSKRRIDDSFRHCKGILVDVFYDHFLACEWQRHHPQPLEIFARRVYDLLQEHFAELPRGLQAVAPRMIEHNWLVSYRELEVVERVLHRLSQRLSRPNPIARGLPQLQYHYSAMGDDCNLFLESARRHLELCADKISP